MVLKEGSPHAYNIHILEQNFPWTTKWHKHNVQLMVPKVSKSIYKGPHKAL